LAALVGRRLEAFAASQLWIALRKDDFDRMDTDGLSFRTDLESLVIAV
jgi:hypothetical protein